MVTTRPHDRGLQGQWSLGQRAPLNHAEELKRSGPPLDVRARVEEVFSREGIAAIPADDLRERLKWWGLYTQRRAGQPAEATQANEPAALAGEHFMMRIRIDGGLLDAAQLRAIAWASQTFGRDLADVTDRQNVQLHWVRIEDVPAIWQRLEAVGLTTAMACGDVPRGFLGCPVAGLADDEVIDATGVLEAVKARAVGNPAFANLPRKFKTSISGCADQCAQPDVNDVAFVGARNADGEAGFDLWVGGGLGSNPHFAQRLGVWVAPERVPDVWEGVASAFRDHGYRKSRKRARLKFLVADWGPERFREVLETEYLEARLPDLPAPQRPASVGGDHVGVFPQADGRRYVGIAPRAGRVAGHQLAAVADLAQRFGSGRTRLTTQQKIVVVDVEADRVDDLVAALAEHDLQARPSPFRTGTMSCTGLEFCKLALAETKANADQLYRELERRLPGWDDDIRIHLNGCPNSCARFQIADIGLMGALLPHPDGGRAEGFLVHLGGAVGGDRAFAAKVKGVRVLATDVVDYVEALLRRYRDRRSQGQSFTAYVQGLDAEELTSFAAPVVPAEASAA
ncbi:sulfite reductase SirA [soil metagenome]